jgi:hypothetical protein
LVLFNYATRYACAKADAALYTKLLEEVIAAEDPDPSLRLTNTIAQRKARRWLSPDRMFNALQHRAGDPDTRRRPRPRPRPPARCAP